jgi:hypothetical protein
MLLKSIGTETKVVTTTKEVPTSVVVELTMEEVDYIQSRLDCSSFKTYADFCPDRPIRRAKFAAQFREATTVDSDCC